MCHESLTISRPCKSQRDVEKLVFDMHEESDAALSKICCNFARSRVRRCPLDDKVARAKAEHRAWRRGLHRGGWSEGMGVVNLSPAARFTADGSPYARRRGAAARQDVSSPSYRATVGPGSYRRVLHTHTHIYTYIQIHAYITDISMRARADTLASPGESLQ